MFRSSEAPSRVDGVGTKYICILEKVTAGVSKQWLRGIVFKTG